MLLLLWLWAGFLAVYLVLAIAALRQPPDVDGRRRVGALITAMLASAVPLISLLVLLYNLARGEAGWDWWIFQIELFYLNLASFLVILVMACLPPYPPRYRLSMASRVALVLAVGCALAYLGIETSGPAPRFF